MINSM